MTAESTRIWRCRSCNRLLVEKGVDYARARHAELLARTRGGSVEFVREATWPAYLASLKRCRCGSRNDFPAVCSPGQACAGIGNRALVWEEKLTDRSVLRACGRALAPPDRRSRAPPRRRPRA